MRSDDNAKLRTARALQRLGLAPLPSQPSSYPARAIEPHATFRPGREPVFAEP
jgi:hypothetical protein